MSKRTKRERKDSAIHESIHAVVALHLGVPVEEINIVQDDPYDGNCKCGDSDDWEKCLLILLAPYAAQCAGCDTDILFAKAIALFALHITADDLPNFMTKVKRRAATIIKKPQINRAIRKLTRALVDRSTLNAMEIINAIDAYEIVQGSDECPLSVA